MTTNWPELDAIEDGYYAVQDPGDPGTVTYWRRTRSATKDTLKPWPAKAWYGPAVPRRSEVPTDPRERDRFARAWSQTRSAYLDKVVATISASPETAARRFAELAIRCCKCGRTLRDKTSKTYGIGPECRSGIPASILARYLTPQVGRAHAKHLASTEETR